MLMKKIIFALALIGLVACNKSRDAVKDPQATSISRDLVKMPELTEAQTEEIKGLTGKSGVLPSDNLLISDEDLGPESKSKREKEIKELSSESKQIFDKVQTDCKLEKPERKVTGELKQNKGDKRETVRTQNTGGDKCPILLKDSSTETVTLTETNLEELVGKDKNPGHVATEKLKKIYQTVYKFNQSLQILSQDLQSQSGLKERVLEGTLTGSHATLDDQNLLSLSSQARGTGHITTVKDTVIAVKTEFEVRYKTGDKEKLNDMYAKYELQYPSSTPVIQAFKADDGKETQFYLNGKATTREKIKELFGLKLEMSLFKNEPAAAQPTAQTQAQK